MALYKCTYYYYYYYYYFFFNALVLLLLLLLCRYTDLPIKETECAFQIKENKVTVAIIFEIFYHNRPSPWTNSIRWHTLDSWKNMLFAHDAYQRRIDVFAVALGT